MSLGLAPRMVDVVFESLERVREAGTAVVMVEQFATRALVFADDALILERGVVTWSGSSSGAGSELLHRYLGEAVV